MNPPETPPRRRFRPLRLLVFCGIAIFLGFAIWYFSISRQGQWKHQTTAELLRYTAANPRDDLALKELADRFEHQQLYAEAIRTYLQAGRADAGKARYFVSAARIAMRHGDREAAIAAVEEALRAEPANSEALSAQGELALRDGNYQAAYAAYRKAVSGNPKSAEAQNGLARAATELRRWAEAKEAAIQATQLAPEHPDYWHTRARAERLAGEPQAARRSSEQGLHLMPDDAALLLESGLAQMQTTPPDFKAALLVLERAGQQARESSQKADSFTALGQIYLKQRDLPRAESAFRQALAAQPQGLDALYGLGQTQQLAGKTADARRTMTQYTTRRSRELAIAQLQMRVGREPNQADLWRRLGDLYFAQENWANTASAYQRSLQLDAAQPALKRRLKQIEDRLRNASP